MNFEDKRARLNPENEERALCYQLFDTLKYAGAAALLGPDAFVKALDRLTVFIDQYRRSRAAREANAAALSDIPAETRRRPARKPEEPQTDADTTIEPSLALLKWRDTPFTMDEARQVYDSFTHKTAEGHPIAARFKTPVQYKTYAVAPGTRVYLMETTPDTKTEGYYAVICEGVAKGRVATIDAAHLDI